MKLLLRLPLVVLFLCGAPVHAAILPSFSLEDSAWNATDIMTVTEGAKIDGKVQILEVWKGPLKAGNEILVPQLASFAPAARREVPAFSPWGDKPVPGHAPKPVHVSGEKIVLFLTRASPQSTKWAPAAVFGGIETAAVWVEGKNTYSFVQWMNPGPSSLLQLPDSYGQMKDHVMTILATQNGLGAAASVADPGLRAKSLRPFVSSRFYYARKRAFAELSKCGVAALPVLRSMLRDPSLPALCGDVIDALGQAGGPAVGAELTQLLESETEFWKQTAPALKVGWWSGEETPWPRVEELRNRYVKVLHALYVLNRLKFAPASSAVTQFRDYWRSMPQREDKSGLNQMSEACDDFLQTLGKSGRK